MQQQNPDDKSSLTISKNFVWKRGRQMCTQGIHMLKEPIVIEVDIAQEDEKTTEALKMVRVYQFLFLKTYKIYTSKYIHSFVIICLTNQKIKR